MSETNVIAMPGMMPEATRPATNEEAIKMLEDTLAEFKAGRGQALLLVSHDPGVNTLRYSTPTFEDKLQIIGLAQAVSHHLSAIVAAAAFK